MNEYLSAARWDILRQTIASALTPVAGVHDANIKDAASELAAHLLAEIGVMPAEN